MDYSLETVVSWAKRKWFVYPGSDIYGWLANAWDLGPYGTMLRKNILDSWYQTFTQRRSDIIPLDAAILMNVKTWEASGHLWNFSDPLIDDKNTGERFRVDKIIEDVIENWNNQLKWRIERKKEIEDLFEEFLESKWYKASFNNYNNRSDFIYATHNIDIYNEFVIKHLKHKDFNLNKYYNKDDFHWDESEFFWDYINLTIDNEITNQLKEEFWVDNLVPESWTFEQMKAFIEKYIQKNPNNWKKANWTDIRKFNLMFKTFQWVTEDNTATIYLRPETAQGIFVNFKNILDTMRVKVPFGISQVGKSFRNEITPWNFLFRVREFEQMEIEYFVEPEKDAFYFERWKEDCWAWWTESLGINKEKLRFRDHEEDELSHYSKGTTDVEYKFPWGWGELQGIARRWDYDLSQHQKHSLVNMQYTDPKTGHRFIPWVIEPSWGLTRAIATAMIDSYDEEKYTDPKWNEQTRIVARFHKNIAPIKFAILPLMEKKQELVDIADKIFLDLSKDFMCEYDGKWNIGKRYRRQDEIWTPFCVTIDFDTLEYNTVTVRDRDSMEQIRVKIEKLRDVYKNPEKYFQ